VLPRAYSRPHQRSTTAYLVLDGDVPGWHVTLSTFLGHVTAFKKCHASLISQPKVRRVTPAP
jgi:hypothetical protein